MTHDIVNSKLSICEAGSFKKDICVIYSIPINMLPYLNLHTLYEYPENVNRVIKSDYSGIYLIFAKNENINKIYKSILKSRKIYLKTRAKTCNSDSH